jgi:hypothetical protein
MVLNLYAVSPKKAMDYLQDQRGSNVGGIFFSLKSEGPGAGSY